MPWSFAFVQGGHKAPAVCGLSLGGGGGEESGGWLAVPRSVSDLSEDTLDAFGLHGMGGIWGAVLTGIFALEEGLIYSGSFLLIGKQIAGGHWRAWAGHQNRSQPREEASRKHLIAL